MGYFGMLDLFNGYWQLPLDKESQQYFSIVTDHGTWTPTRLIQGSKNAAGPFQAVITQVVGDLLHRGCLVYIDDILVYGRTEEEFIRNWITVIEALHSVGLKISAKKTVFYAKEVKYCGRIFSASGTRFDPQHIEALSKMPTPTTAAELRSFLASVNWIRSSIPNYTTVVAPLQDLLTAALRSAPDTRSGSAKKGGFGRRWLGQHT